MKGEKNAQHLCSPARDQCAMKFIGVGSLKIDPTIVNEQPHAMPQTPQEKVQSDSVP